MAEIVKIPKFRSDIATDITRHVFRHQNDVLGMALIALLGLISMITKGLIIGRANIVNVLSLLQ